MSRYSFINKHFASLFKRVSLQGCLTKMSLDYHVIEVKRRLEGLDRLSEPQRVSHHNFVGSKFSLLCV